MNTSTPVIWEHNREFVNLILNCVEDGVYSALLGPRYFGKTAILRHVVQRMRNSSQACFYIDLFEIQALTHVGFFTDLANAIKNNVSEYTNHPINLPAEELNSAVFRDFLSQCVDHIGNNMTVIFDHLEGLPSDINRALLTSLRALHMEQQDSDLQFIAVVSGALSLAALTVGETSPFHGIARRFFLSGLNEEESKASVTQYTNSPEVQLSPNAFSSLLDATQGNPHLIRLICKRCLMVAGKNPSKLITVQTVGRVVRDFLRTEAPKYELLQEAVRLIEDDPDLLQSILKLLNSNEVPMRELPLPLLPDLDPLYLTGMVERGKQDSYRIRNGIYRQYLREYFDAGRVGYLLTVSGRWDAAIGHLESSINSGNQQSQPDLLAATINSMYASESVEQAAYYLIRGLSAGFQANQISIWWHTRDWQSLQLLDQKGATLEGVLPTDVQEIPLEADRIETRSFRQVSILRDQQDEICTRYVIPLVIPGHAPMGVVTLCNAHEHKVLTEQRIREFHIQRYLNQAARAFYEIELRRRREIRSQEQDEQLEKQTRQLFLLHRISTLSQTITDLEKISHLILTSITANFGLGFNRAWLFLINNKTNGLTGKLGIGSFTEAEAHQAWERSAHLSFNDYVENLLKDQMKYTEIDQATRKLTIPIKESSHDLFSMTIYQQHSFLWSGEQGHWHELPQEFRQRFEPGEMILTPLIVNNSSIGLIAVDNKFSPRMYTETDELLLRTFANQMATAIFNKQQREQETQRYRLEEILRDTSLIIGSSLDQKEVLHRILEEMRKVLPFDTASIQLAVEGSSELRIIAEAGFDDPGSVEALVFPLEGNYPNVLVYEKKEPLHFDDIQEHFPHFADPYYQATHVHGWLGAPLIINDKVIGVITLDSRTPQVYTSEHDRMAVLFAGQASVAIENARLFQAEKDSKEYLDLLVESSQDGIIAVDNKGWVIRYSEGAQKILGYAPEEVLNKQKRVDKLYGSLEVAQKINEMLLGSGKVRDFQTTILDKDDISVPIVLSASLLRDKAGNPLGSVGFFKDLRALRKVENYLRTVLDTVSIMSKVDHSESGLYTLAERIVTAQPVTFCTILLLDEIKQHLIMKVSYPNPRPGSSAVDWEPVLGERIPLIQSNIMSHLVKLPDSHVFQAGQQLAGMDIVEQLQHAFSLEEEIQSILVVPLKAGNEVFGICILGETRSWSRSPLDKDKIELISSMITQGSVFVDRLRAQEAIQNKLMMVEQLRSIGEDLVAASPGAEKSILEKVVQAACDIMGASNAVIYPMDQQTRTYDTDKIVHFGLRKKKFFSDKVRDEEGSMTSIVLRKRIVIVDDIQNGHDRSGETRIWTDWGGFLENEGVQAFVGVSLRTGEDVLGVLFVNFLNPHYFSNSELELVNLFANQAVIAIENARLYEELALKLEESRTLQKVSTSLTDTSDLNLLLNRVLQAAFELIQADDANILFYDKEKDELSIDALKSGGVGKPLQPYQTRMRQRKGYTYQILKSKTHISIPDTMRDPNINPATLQKGRRAAIGVPLIGRESPVGVIWMHWRQPHQISERDERLLMSLASQAAISIENANLFEQLKTENNRRNEESQALQGVGISLTESIEYKEVLYRILQAALELVQGDEGSILFYDESTDEFDTNALMCSGVGQPLETYQTKVRQRAGLAHQIVKDRRGVFIPDTLLDPRISKVAIDKGRRATVGVPLLDADGPVGVLWVNWKQTRQVSSREANLLTTLASQATVAIKGARRYEEMQNKSAEIQRRSVHLQAVHEAGKVISAASVGMGRQQVLDRILEQAIECVTGVYGPKASVGTIQLVDEERNELVVVSVFPPQYPRHSIDKFDHILLGANKPPDSRIGITGRSFLTRQPILVPDVSKDNDYIEHNQDTRAELAIPMLDGQKVIGVMDVESNKLNAFDDLDKDSLGLLVDLAVVALNNTTRAEQLARSNTVALMGAWGAEVAHDINREVGYIRRDIFMLQERSDLPFEVKERLANIEQSAERLAQPDVSGKEPDPDSWLPSKIKCNLSHAIHIAVTRYRTSHPQINWQYKSSSSDIQLAIHETRLLSILRHLLRNAAHALTQMRGELERSVNIRTMIVESTAIIEVEDNGPGVHPEIRPTLFQEPVSHDDGRKGSGLLLIRFISEQYGGRVELAEQRQGRGACFRVYLPIVISENED